MMTKKEEEESEGNEKCECDTRIEQTSLEMGGDGAGGEFRFNKETVHEECRTREIHSLIEFYIFRFASIAYSVWEKSTDEKPRKA